MKYFLLGVLSGALTLLLAIVLYLRLGFAQVQADLPPSSWENKIMYASVHASVRRRAPEIPNPFPPTDQNLIEGGKNYLAGCAGCHGSIGKPFGGRGPVLYPPIPELPVIGTGYSEAQIMWIAKHGLRRSGMFANGVWASDKFLWTTAAFIERIKDLPPDVRTVVEKMESEQH